VSRVAGDRLPPVVRGARSAAPAARGVPAPAAITSQGAADDLLSAAMQPASAGAAAQQAAPSPPMAMPSPAGAAPAPDTAMPPSRGGILDRVFGGRTSAPPTRTGQLAEQPAPAQLPPATKPTVLQVAAKSLLESFGPRSFETRCGFKLRGARVAAVHSPHAGHEVFDDPAGSLVRIDPRAGDASSVLLELDDGCSVLLPAIPEFIAELHFDDGELVHLAYEPAETSPRRKPCICRIRSRWPRSWYA